MLAKKIFTCLTAAFIITCSSSFSSFQPSSPDTKTASLSTIYLWQKKTVSGVDYNIYIQYDTGTGTVLGAQIYLNNCIECAVTAVSQATFMHQSGFSWYTTGSVTVNSTCGTFVISGKVLQQDPYC